MKKWTFLFLATLSTLSLKAVVGTYSVSGFDPYENKPYTGRLEIKKDKNEVYQASWLFSDGESAKGTGLMGNNEISFVYTVKGEKGNNPPTTGLQMYKIQGNSLSGSWVMLNNNLVGTETLVKQ